MIKKDFLATKHHIDRYAVSDNQKALKEVVSTCLFQLTLYLFVWRSQYIAAALILQTLLNLRWIVLFHDTTHGSFFRTKKYNQWTTFLCEQMILIPGVEWKDGHFRHHMCFGNVDAFDPADSIIIFNESRWKNKWILWLRFPPLYFVLFPIMMWWIILPLKYKRFIAIHVGHYFFMTRVILADRSYFWVPMLALFLSASLGTLAFHLQHSIAPGYRVSSQKWTHEEAALYGSTLMYVPRCLKFFSLGIEYHHIHHFNSQVPSYMLQRCHDEAPEGMFDMVTRLDSWKKLKESFWYTTWENNEFKFDF